MLGRVRGFEFSAGVLLSAVAWAHVGLNQDMRHDLSLTVGPEYLDVAVCLTVTGATAETLRAALDTNHDHVVGTEELRAPLPERILGDTPLLTADGKSVALMTLYAPVVDLLGDNTTSAHALRFQLSYFARTPEGLDEDFEVRLKDRFLHTESALLTISVSGSEGIAAQVVGPRSQRCSPRTSRVIVARCGVSSPSRTPSPRHAAPTSPHRENSQRLTHQRNHRLQVPFARRRLSVRPLHDPECCGPISRNIQDGT